MKLHVDKEADALYLRLDDSQIVESEEVSPGIVLDFNSQNCFGPRAAPQPDGTIFQDTAIEHAPVIDYIIDPEIAANHFKLGTAPANRNGRITCTMRQQAQVIVPQIKAVFVQDR